MAALTITYGQKHAIEVEAARQIAAAFHVLKHDVIHVPLDQWGGSSLTTSDTVPKDRVDDGGIPTTYVPARNTIFLALALGFAEAVGSSDIFIGISSVDYSGYPDCRPEYLEAFVHMARLATKTSVEGGEIRIHAPLLHLSKEDTIRLGLSLGVDYGMTHSCYDPELGVPCGHCDSCRIRQRAFAQLDMADPALN